MCVRKKVLLILTIAMTLFIWGQSMIPNGVSYSESTAIDSVISNTYKTLNESQGTEEKQNKTVKYGLNVLLYIRYHLRKIAHILEYFVLGVLLLSFISECKIPFSKLIYIFCTTVFLVGFFDESIQLIPILNRSAEINDIWLDFLGSLLGGSIALIIIYVRKRRMT